MKQSILIIIDMQASFLAARNPKTILACQALILKAKKELNPIFFIEYKWNGPTLPQLTSLVNDYVLKFTIQKEEDNGAEEIENQFYRGVIIPSQ